MWVGFEEFGGVVKDHYRKGLTDVSNMSEEEWHGKRSSEMSTGLTPPLRMTTQVLSDCGCTSYYLTFNVKVLTSV